MPRKPLATRAADALFRLCLSRRTRWLWPVLRPVVRLLEVFER